MYANVENLEKYKYRRFRHASHYCFSLQSRQLTLSASRIPTTLRCPSFVPLLTSSGQTCGSATSGWSIHWSTLLSRLAVMQSSKLSLRTFGRQCFKKANNWRNQQSTPQRFKYWWTVDFGARINMWQNLFWSIMQICRKKTNNNLVHRNFRNLCWNMRNRLEEEKSRAFLSSGRGGATTRAAIQHYYVYFVYLISTWVNGIPELQKQWRLTCNFVMSTIFTVKMSDKFWTMYCSCGPWDRVGVEINHVSLDKRVLVPFTPAEAICAEKILSVIERIQQSNQEFDFDQNMRMKLVIVKKPRGGEKSRYEGSTTRIVNWDDWDKKHSGHGGCFVQVPL